MPTAHDETISTDELHSLLKANGLTIGPGSPLVGLPAASAEIGREALGARGLLDNGWGQALQALQAPTRCFRTLKAFPDATVVSAYYADGSNDGLIGCWPEGGRMRIGFPYSPDDLVLEGSTALGADFAIVRDPLTAELSPAGLAVLAAAVDVMRQRLFDSLLARNTEVAMDLRPEQLQQAYADGLAAGDARWLVTLLRLLMPVSVALPESLSDAGMAELIAAGLIQTEGDHWLATDALARLTAYLKTPLPAVAHEALTLEAGKAAHYAYVIAVRGDGPAWTFQFWQEAGRVGVTLRSRMGGSYRRFLANMLAPLFAAAPASDSAPNRTPQAPAQAPSAEKTFCTNCGAPAQSGAAFCIDCGRKL